MKINFLYGAGISMLFSPTGLTAERAEEEPITVSANRSETRPGLDASFAQQQHKLSQIAGGTNLISQEETGRLATLQDALDYQPGIMVQNFFGGTDQPQLNIRGSGVQSAPLSRGVTLLQDGLPINDADGGFHISLLESRESKLISVRRGANALNPTSNALGGELDFISYTGRDETGRVRYEYGSFGRQGWQAALGGADNTADGRISVSGDHFGGYRDHSSSQRNAVRANSGFTLGDRFENRTWFSWTDLRFDIAGSLPQRQIKDNPTGVYNMVWLRDPHRNVEQARIANRSIWRGQGWSQELGLWLQHTHDNFVTPRDYILSNSLTTGAQWQALAQHNLFDYRLALAADNSDMQRELQMNRRGMPGDRRSLGKYDLDAANQHLSLGLSWQPVDSLRMNADLKGSHSVRNVSGRNNAASLDQSWRYLTPKMGLIWTPATNQRWFTNLSWSNEAPTFREILSSRGNTARLSKLNLQRAVTLEIGGDGAINSALNWDVSLYHSRIKDELISTYDERGDAVGTFNYASKTKHQGAELGFKGYIPVGHHGLQYRAAWTYSDFRFLGGEYQGKRIAGIPKQQIAAELLYTFGDWALGPNLHWLPNITPVDHQNNLNVQYRDSYAVWGFKINYRRPDGWSAYLSADNLGDTRYATASSASRAVTSQTANTQFPGMAFSLNAGVSYAF